VVKTKTGIKKKTKKQKRRENKEMTSENQNMKSQGKEAKFCFYLKGNKNKNKKSSFVLP